MTSMKLFSLFSSRHKRSRLKGQARILSYEVLELRRLLALEILRDVINPGVDIHYYDPEEIVVHAGVKLDAGGKSIKLESPKITIYSDVRLGSEQVVGGGITLKAYNVYDERGSPVALGRVAIGANAKLQGSSISIFGEHLVQLNTTQGSTSFIAKADITIGSAHGTVDLGSDSGSSNYQPAGAPPLTIHTGGGDLSISGDSIIIGANSVLHTGGGKLELSGRGDIDIQYATTLDTQSSSSISPGEISIRSDNRLVYLPISIYDTFALSTRPNTTSSIKVGEKVMIKGGDITLDSKAGDQGLLVDPSFLRDGTSSGLMNVARLKDVSTIGLEALNELIPFPISILVRKPNSQITLSSGVKIDAAGDLTISSQSDAFAIATAVWKFIDAVVPFFGGAVGVSYTDAIAKLDVLHDAQLTASQNVSLVTHVGNITSSSAGVDTEKTKRNIAVGLAIQNSTAHLAVSQGSEIAAGKQVYIDASAKDLKQAQARSSSFGDLYAGIVVAGVEGATSVEALVDGHVYAFGSAPAKELTFDPQTQIDYADNALIFDRDVPFHDGESINYRIKLGVELPSLQDGQQLFAMVDPSNRRKLKLADSKSNFHLRKAISFGLAYPTLTDAKGNKVSIFQIDSVDNSLLFEWPDDAPLFADGQSVFFSPASSRFIGHNDPAGHLIGELPQGDYRVELLPGSTPRALRLIDSQGKVVDLNDNPVFQTESGRWLQVSLFDSDQGTVDFNFDPSSPIAPPNQKDSSNPAWTLKAGEKLRYMGALGTRLVGIESQVDYYAIPDPSSPGVVQLAASYRQAKSAAAGLVNVAPQLEAVLGTIGGRGAVSISNVNLDGKIVLAVDPMIQSPIPVVYHASPGLALDGLVDGTTYFASSVVNSEMSSDRPEYFLELRESQEVGTAPIVVRKRHVLVDANGSRFPVASIDAMTQWLSVELPSDVHFSGVDSSALDGRVSHRALSSDFIQFWSTADTGQFALQVFDPADTTQSKLLRTRMLAWNATAAQVQAALQEILSSSVQVLGVGTAESPWLIYSPGVTFSDPATMDLLDGQILYRTLDENYFTVETDSKVGSFVLEMQRGAQVIRSKAIAWNATSGDVQNALSGFNLQTLVFGRGTSDNPWVIRCWSQSIDPSALLTFQPSWGLGQFGLIANEAYYVQIAPSAMQSIPGSLVLGLAIEPTTLDKPIPERLSLFGATEFHAEREIVPTGISHALSTTQDGIYIQADLISKDVLRTGVDRRLQKQKEYDAELSKKQKLLSLIPIFNSNLGNLFGLLKTEFETSPLAIQSGDDLLFSVSPTVAWMHVNNSVRAIVQQNARLVTAGRVDVQANIVEYLTTKAQATVSAPSKTRVGAAVSVNWVRISNSVDALIESNAQVTGAAGVWVDSETTYPWQGLVYLNPNATNQLDPLPVLGKTAYKLLSGQNGTGIFTGKIGLNDFVLNHYTSAASHSAIKDQSIPWAVSTSLSWLDLQNQTWAQIEDGAQINTIQSTPTSLGTLTIVPSENQPVVLSSQTNAIQTSFTGNVIANIDINLVSIGRTRNNLPFINSDIGTNSGQQALGGAVGSFAFGTDTRAVLGGLRKKGQPGVAQPERIPKAPLTVNAGSAGLDIQAINNVTIIQASQGSGKATNFGFSGSGAIAKGSQANAYAAIEAGSVDRMFSPEGAKARIQIRNPDSRSSDGIRITASDDTQLIPISGAVFISENKGAGVSTSIAELHRNVSSLITGLTLSDDPASMASLKRIPLEITVDGNIQVNADATGLVIPTAIAAAIASGSKPTGRAEFAPDEQVENAAQQGKGVFGIAISGDYSLADVDDCVRSIIDLSSSDGLTGSIVNPRMSNPKLQTHAQNTTVATSSSGAAAIVSGNGSSLGLAGSVAMIVGVSETHAIVRNATLGRYSLEILAEDQRRIGSIAAGGSGTRSPNKDAWTVNSVGSFVRNHLTTNTEALIESIAGENLGSISVRALDSDVVWAAAGSFQFNLQFDLRDDLEEVPKNTKPAKSYGVGVAICLQESRSNTTATVKNSKLETHRGGVIVLADEASQYYSFAAAVAAGSMSVQAEGMFVNVSIYSNCQSTIDSGSLTISPEVGVGQSDLIVASNSNPLLITAAGDLVRTTAASAAFAAGVAVAVVSGTIESGASIKGNGKVRSKRGGVVISSKSSESVPDPRSASVLSEVYTPNRDSSALWTFVVGVVSAKSASLAGDFSVISQSMNSNRKASIEDHSSVALDRGRLIVESIDEADVYSAAGAITSAGGTKDKPNTVAVGAAFNRTTVSMQTMATIANATISVIPDDSPSDVPSVDVHSQSKSNVWVLSVGAEVSGKVALGFSVSIADVNHEIKATLGDLDQKPAVPAVPSWTLNSVGGVSITANDSTQLICTAGQVAIATNGVAGGAAAATSRSINKVQAGIVDYRVKVEAGELKVNAVSESILKTIAIGVAGVGGAGKAWPVSLSGVGSGTGNRIARQVESSIVSSEILSANAIDVRASDNSDLISVAGVADFQLNGKSKVSVAVGTSAATNDFGSDSNPDQSSFVRSWIVDSKLKSLGAVEVNASGTQKLKAWTSAGAGKFAKEETPVIGFNNAGSGSGNTIQSEVSAIVDGSSLIQISTNQNGLNIVALNSPSIFAVSGGVSIAGAQSDGKGVSVEIGAAATTNTVDYKTLALVRNNSVLTSSQSLVVKAISDATIQAIAYGVASSIRKGSAGTDVDLAGAGTACVNTIKPLTQASILAGSRVGLIDNRIGGVSLDARDQSSITAGSGGLSSLFSFGEASQVGLSVGVSFTVNLIQGDTLATVENSTIYSSGPIEIGAQFSTDGDENIKSISVAGTLDLELGGGGILFPLVGAGNKNKVEMNVRSQVIDRSLVNSQSHFNLNAIDTSELYSNAGGVGLGLTFNKADLSGGVAIGAAKVVNEIRNTVESAVEGSTVNSADPVWIQSELNPSMKVIAYGVALSTTVSSSALSAAGSGASIDNSISNASVAGIADSDVKSALGSVSILAADHSDMQSSAGAGSLAIAIGNAVSLAPGVVLLDTKVSNTVSATVNNPAEKLVLSGGDIVLSAKTEGVYQSTGVAVAAAASAGAVSVSFSGAGGHSNIELTNVVKTQHVSGQLEAQGTINLISVSRDRIPKNTMGVGALSVGEFGASIGVSLSESEIRNQVTAEVLGGALNATSGDLVIESYASHAIYTETVPTSLAVSIGGAGAGGHAFSTDSSQIAARVLGSPVLVASSGGLVVRTDQVLENEKPIDALIQAHAGAGVGGLAAIGAVVVESTDKSTRQATIGDYLDLRGVGRLQVLANAAPNLVARSTAVDVGGIAVNVNRSTVTAGGSVVSATGSGVFLPSGPVSLLAKSSNVFDVEQLGITGGVVAAGATLSEAYNSLVVSATLGKDNRSEVSRQSSLSVQAMSDDSKVNILTVAGTGGFFAGQGATGLLSDESKTMASILSGEIHAGTVAIDARRSKILELGVDAATISVALGIGITTATYEDNSQVSVSLGQKLPGSPLHLVALDTITVSASNHLRRREDSIWTKGIGGSGIESISGVIAKATLNAMSTITIEDGASISTGVHPLTRPGGIIMLPSLNIDYQTHTNISNLSFLIAGSVVKSETTGNLVSSVIIGNRVDIRSQGDLLIGNDATISSSNQSAGWGSAVLTSQIDQSTSIDLHLDQKVIVGDHSTLSAMRNISLTASQDPRAGQSSLIDLRAHAVASSTSLLPAAQSKASATLTENIHLDIGNGAILESGADTLLHARNSKPVFDVLGEASYYYLFLFKKQDYVNSSIHYPASQADIRGTVVAGKQNRLSVEIPNDQNNQFTNTVRFTPDQLYGIPLNTLVEHDPQFNPIDYINSKQVSPEIASALRDGVSTSNVQATKIGVRDLAPPIVLSGGSVYVVADKVYASNAILEARVASIDINNHSPNYLLLGSVMIANVLGGLVQFQTSDGSSLSDPSGMNIRRDTATPAIRVNLNYSSSVGNSSNGPALFITKPLANLGGLISIQNTAGSFGQFASIAAKEVDISTPNGVFAVDLPQSNWTAAGSPAALYTRDPSLPLAYTADILQNAEHATMVGVNATYMEGLPNWRTAANDTELNDFVYGRPEDAARKSSWVFFGGSVPQDSGTGDGNSEAKNKAWAQNARLDGESIALKLTDKTPRLGKNEGWDHAWVPSLQRVPVEGSLSTLASRKPTLMVQGQVVVIRAKTVNVNGTIQSGQSNLANHSIVVPEAIENKLLSYQADYRSGSVSSPVLEIPKESLALDKPTDALIGAHFDARTGQIHVDSVEASGGGRVQIIGRILNTDIAGKIKLTGGSGDITVRNRTSLQLNLGKLQTQSGGKKGVVSITDLNIADASERQIAYVYNGTEILVYRGPDGADVISEGTLRDRIVATSTSYQLQPGLRWNWELQASVHRDVNFDLNKWSGVQASSWRFNRPSDNVYSFGQWSLVNGIDGGSLSTNADTSAISQKMTSKWEPNTYGLSFTVPYSKYNWDTGFKQDRFYDYPNSMDLGMQFSIKADYPIGIDFSELRFGNVVVDSDGSVLLGGSIVAPDVQIASHKADIRTLFRNIAVDASRVSLSAESSIGSLSSLISISADTLSMDSKSGSIYIDVNRNLDNQNIQVESMTAPLGIIVLHANGPIVSGKNGSLIQGRQVDLWSRSGGIGTVLQPVRLQAPTDWGSLRINARSSGDVMLDSFGGDLLVGLIDAQNGNVQIDSQENVFSGESWTIDPERDQARLGALIATGATDPFAHIPDIQGFENRVSLDYRLYWALRNSGDVQDGVYRLRDSQIPLWKIRAEAILGQQGISDEDVRTQSRILFEGLSEGFAVTIGSDWSSRPEFQEQQSTYRYAVSAQQEERFKQGRTVAKEPLSIALLSRALEIPNRDLSIDKPSIRAKELRLISRAGSIGKLDTAVEIPTSRILEGDLTDAQLREISLATRPGDAILDENLDVLSLRIKRPLVIDVFGRLDAIADGNVVVTDPSGPLRVGNIGSAHGKITLISEGSLWRARGETLDFSGVELGFEQPLKWRTLGTSGQSLNAFSGLFVPGNRNTVSATWYSDPVFNSSFRASFVYVANTNDESNAGDGLAFVLRSENTDDVGNLGGQLGYGGLPGKKVGLLINLYNRNGEQRGTRFDTTGTVGSYKKSLMPLVNRPVYVTLTYDATTSRLTVTLGQSNDDRSPEITIYEGVDLQKLLGNHYYLGFTTATGDAFCSQSIQDFRFAISDSTQSQQIEFPVSGIQANWSVNRLATNASDPSSGFSFVENAGANTLVFPEKIGIASSAWYQNKVSIDGNFYVRFNYQFVSSNSLAGDGLAFVFHNSPKELAALGASGADLGYGSIDGPKVGLLLNLYKQTSGGVLQGIRFDTLGKSGNYSQVEFTSGTVTSIALSYNRAAKSMVVEVHQGERLINSFSYDGVDLPALLGGSTAWMGFTAASGASTAKQTVSEFSFYSPPPPPEVNAGVRWHLNGDVQLLSNGTLDAPSAYNSVTSTWFDQPISMKDFRVEFTYSATEKLGSDFADGMAFVIQDGTAGVAARGLGGSKLGYGGLKGKKIGVLFNVYRTPGIRFDDGSESGEFIPVNWLSGRDVQVQISYESRSSSLTVQAFGKGILEPFRKTWHSVDLSKLVGLAGLVGVTTSTGAFAARHTISNFRLTQPNTIWAMQESVGDQVAIRLLSQNGDIGTNASPIKLYGQFQATAPNGHVYTDPSQVSLNGGLLVVLQSYTAGENTIRVIYGTPGENLLLFSGTEHAQEVHPSTGILVGIKSPKLLGQTIVGSDGSGEFTLSLSENEVTPSLFEVVEVASDRTRRSGVLYGLPPMLVDDQGPVGEALTQESLLTLGSQAKLRWLGLALSSAEQSRLSNVRFELKELGVGKLTQLVGEVLYVDPNGGGNTWYIDPSPAQDSEFARLRGKSDLYAYQDASHADQIDLLSALVLGLAPVVSQDVASSNEYEFLNRGPLSKGVRRLLADQRIDPWNPNDVNRDGAVNPIDALMIIDWLNRTAIKSSGDVDDPASLSLDTNFDSFISPLDALEVIHQLNFGQEASQAEGESTWGGLSAQQVDEYWAKLRD